MLWQIFVVAFVVAGKHGCEALQLNGVVAIAANGVLTKQLKVYADGNLEQTYDGSSQSYSFTVSAAEVLAFHAHITSTPGTTTTAGFLAHFNTNFVVTNSNFRCRTIQGTTPDDDYPGWSGQGYNDNNWPAAIIKAPNSSNAPSPFYQVSNVSDAKWIWTGNNAGMDIICRKKL